MKSLAERQLVYSALLIACVVIGLGAGASAAAWSFLQVALIIEFASWLGPRQGGYYKRRW